MTSQQEKSPLTIDQGARVSHQGNYEADRNTQNWSSQSVSVTVFPSTDASTKEPRTTTWGALVQSLKTPKEYRSKQACPLISGAAYGDRRTARGCLRHSGNVERVYLIEGDYDGEEVSPEEAARRLEAAGIEAVVYTTASHTPSAPRWRVFALLSSPCAPVERRRHVATLNGALGGVLNAESFALSQSFYFGRVAGVPHACIHVAGDPIDLDLMGLEEVYPVGLSAHPVTDDDESMPEAAVSDETVEDMRSALLSLPDQWADEYPQCVAVLQNLKHLEWCGRSEAEELARSFAQRSAKFTEAWFAQKWRRQLHPWRGHFRKIFADAQAGGWTNPKKKPEPADVLNQLREMDAEQLKTSWADLAATLTPEGADEAKNLVHRVTGIGKRPLDASLKAARDRLARTQRKAAAQRGGRVAMLYRPDDSVQQSQEIMRRILAAHPVGECLMFADLLSMLTERPLPYAHGIGSDDEPPPASILIQAHTDVTVRALIEKTVVMQVELKDGPASIAVPPLITSAALEMPPAETPTCSGHIAHPIVLQDGSILAANGLDSRTGLYLHSIDGEPPRPFKRAEAAAALQRLEGFFEGFPFASKRDRHVAVAALLTAIVRRILDAAPALVIVAPVQSSGKTTLARFIHLVLTGRDMPVVTLTLGRDDETEKRLVAMLMHSPPMITFDNVTEGMTLRCGPAFNAVLTAAEYESRLLGLTRKVVVPTNTFVCVTGNNLRFGADEVSRMLTVSLAPQEARPEQRRFKVRNIVAHVRTMRSRVLRDALGIVAGFLASGDRVDLPTGSRFSQWDRMVREPMVWAGATDPAECFAANAADSDHEVALRVLLQVLQQEFGDETFTARDVLGIQWSSKTGDDSAGHAVADSLEALRARDVRSAKSIGRVLTAYVGRTVEIRPGFSLRLQARSAAGRPQLYCVTQGAPLV